jgi:hypothetical protein
MASCGKCKKPVVSGIVICEGCKMQTREDELYLLQSQVARLQEELEQERKKNEAGERVVEAARKVVETMNANISLEEYFKIMADLINAVADLGGSGDAGN